MSLKSYQKFEDTLNHDLKEMCDWFIQEALYALCNTELTLSGRNFSTWEESQHKSSRLKCDIDFERNMGDWLTDQFAKWYQEKKLSLTGLSFEKWRRKKGYSNGPLPRI